MKWPLLISLSAIFIVLILIFTNPIFFGITDQYYIEIEKKAFENNSSKPFTEQLKFREQAFAVFKKNLAVYNNLPYSDIHNTIKINNNQLFLLSITKTTLSTKLNNQTFIPYFLVGFDSLKIAYSISEAKINSIINNQPIELHELENILKYQDCLNISYKAIYHLRIGGLIIMLGIWVFIYFAASFFISFDEDEVAETIKEKIELLRQKIRWNKSDSNYDEELKKLKIDELRTFYNKSLTSFEDQLIEIETNNKEHFIIENIAHKAELKMKEVGNRSNLMLVAGLIMAFIGVIVFYITLPVNLGSSPEIWKIIALSIRPTLILIFIEGIAWYLLRQHKSLLTDYRYYHSIFNKKLNYLASYKLIRENKSNDNNLQNILPLTLLSEEIKTTPERKEDEATVETSNNLLISLIDKLMGKF